MTNRLHLDFSLVTTEERNTFIHQYLAKEPFITRPPTEEELETIGNYLLWGKNKDGLNAKQSDGIDIETKHGTWDKDASIESLEGLMESPTFNEAALSSADTQVPYKLPRETFSRKEALARCPDFLVPTFRELFHQIDKLDLMINFYELRHGKRKNPPRDALLAKFSDEEQETMRETITHWNQYRYLKMRHQLVDLRREQYTLRDSYSQVVLPQGAITPIVVDEKPQIDCDIAVLPLGTKNTSTAALLVF